MKLGLKAVSDRGDGYFEVAAMNMIGVIRIYLWSPPRNRMEDSEKLCNNFITRIQDEAEKIEKIILEEPS